jgi:hypothetical protein
MAEAQTAKTTSEEFSRIEEETLLFRGRPKGGDVVSCVAMGEYNTVDKKKAMSISIHSLRTVTWLLDSAPRFK